MHRENLCSPAYLCSISRLSIHLPSSHLELSQQSIFAASSAPSWPCDLRSSGIAVAYTATNSRQDAEHNSTLKHMRHPAQTSNCEGFFGRHTSLSSEFQSPPSSICFRNEYPMSTAHGSLWERRSPPFTDEQTRLFGPTVGIPVSFPHTLLERFMVLSYPFSSVQVEPVSSLSLYPQRLVHRYLRSA